VRRDSRCPDTPSSSSIATTASWESLREAATSGHGDKPARSTTTPWTDALERTWISDPLEPWLPGFNHLGRLATSAKHHLADPALACALLSLDEHDLIAGKGATPAVPRDGVFLGALFESLVALTLRVFAQAAEATIGHLRRRNGDHEVDFVLSGHGGRRVAVEVKLSALVEDHDVRHLLWLKGELGDELTDMVVVTTGRHAYRRQQDGVAVVPLALLGPQPNRWCATSAAARSGPPDHYELVPGPSGGDVHQRPLPELGVRTLCLVHRIEPRRSRRTQ